MEIRDLCIGREYRDKMQTKKTQWTRIGTMFIKPGDDGELKINMVFDCYPAHGENVVAFKKKPREDNQSQTEQKAPAEELPTVNLDEEEEIRIEDAPF